MMSVVAAGFLMLAIASVVVDLQYFTPSGRDEAPNAVESQRVDPLAGRYVEIEKDYLRGLELRRQQRARSVGRVRGRAECLEPQ
jgi:hypothetical protein